MEHMAKRAGGHLTSRTFWKVGLFLAVVTAFEIAIPYTAALRPVMVPLLLVLSAVKFGWVAAYFMHLKVDPRVLSWIFAAGLTVALMVVTALLIVRHH